MTEVADILRELTEIDQELARFGGFAAGERDGLLERRRNLEAEFDGLRRRPDYLDAVTAASEKVRADLVTHPVTQPFSLEELRPLALGVAD